VAGSIEQPRVTGQLQLVRGFMAVVGKTFRLSRGTVTFPPGEAAVPRLNVAAVYNMTGYTVTVSAEGPVTAPTIRLSSSPSLPRDEIVSRVLFDKSTTRLTPAEAVQLAAAISELAGVGDGGVIGFARRTLGVDVLRVEETGANGDSVPAVSAGKYLTDRVYVGVKQGATPESGAVGVEVELTPNISLDSEMKRSGASNFGVKFKYDY
jgi:translocation and assembly module TamB